MEESAEAYHYICSRFCFFRLSLLCFVLLVASLASTRLISFGFCTFLISLSVLVFLFLLLLTKKKRTLENSVQNEDLINDHENLLQRKLQPENGTITQNKAAQQNELDQIHPYHVGSLDFPPNGGSEDDTITSVDFELNWICPNNVHWGPISSSDDDDDDDDNLIEISLPKKSIKNVKEELRQKPQQSKSDSMPEYIFQQEGLMEQLAEMNEEENLIEIDISMGSIKCSRFEIESRVNNV